MTLLVVWAHIYLNNAIISTEVFGPQYGFNHEQACVQARDIFRKSEWKKYLEAECYRADGSKVESVKL